MLKLFFYFRYKCNENFNEEMRKQICAEYYALSDDAKQKQYLSSLIIIGGNKMPKTLSNCRNNII